MNNLIQNRILHLGLCLFLFSISSISQVVTPWLTTGNKTSLLQPQTQIVFSSNSASASTNITIDSTLTYQAMDGFGFCLTEGSAEVISALSAQQQDALMNELFDKTSGLGISVLRISIGASDLSSADYTYNDIFSDTNISNFSLNGLDKTCLLPILKKALAINPDIKILATPWTAPRWMKTNQAWMGGYLISTYYQAYANYFVKYFDAMKAEGISIWAITPQNEPLHTGNDPSMGMSSTEQKNFINNNLGPAMAAAGYSNVKIIAYDHNCDNTAYPIDVCNNSSYVDGSAFHLYAGDISALTVVKNATNKNVYFTEQYTGSGGSFSGDLGWHLQNVITGAANNWAKAIVEWNLANNMNMGPHTSGGCTTCLGAITVNNSTSFTRNVSYYIIGQISKFVKPGSLRIGSVSSRSTVNVSAFKNLDGSTAVLAYNNSGNSQILKVINGTLSFNYMIPGSSAVTFVWNENTSAISKIIKQGVTIYPTLANDFISIKGDDSAGTIKIYNMNGKEVFRQNQMQNNKTINISNLINGVYIVKLESESGLRYGRFIKY
ncbi:MAG: T9SS type A sorting domain-containing protein [Bacteroidales bacterium]|nr:T9SS type A sorting domain-containing protein [Bacteroidales bacterium]